MSRGKSRTSPYIVQAIGVILATLILIACTPSTPTVAPATSTPEIYTTPYYGRVNVREAIVRQSPDIESPEITRPLWGTSVSVIARQGEWVQVEETFGSGWIYAELLTISDSPPTPTPTMTPSSTPTSTPTPHPTDPTARPSPSPTSAPSTLSATPTTTQPSPTVPPTRTPTPYPPIALVEPVDEVVILEQILPGGLLRHREQRFQIIIN